MQEAEIATMLRDNGVAMIVAQRNFWQDLQEMARLTNVLNTDNFRVAATFPITGHLEMNDGGDESGKGQVDIFAPTYPVEAPKGPITIDLPIIGQNVTGSGAK